MLDKDPATNELWLEDEAYVDSFFEFDSREEKETQG